VQITEKELIQIISEEIDKMVENNEIDEGVLDRLKAQAAGATATLNPFADEGDAALKKAASVMNSYSNHLLKLQQKLDMDAQKLGIDGAEELQQVSNAIKQIQQKVQQVAKGAPTSEKMKAAIQQKFAAQQAEAGGQDQQATQPAAAPAPAAQPASGQRQPSQSPRNVRRRARRAAETPDQRDARLARRRQRDAARRAAQRQAAQTSAPANESKINDGETLNEQLQKISERWRFGK
tara:strand:- start:10592 stop:11299 length:708 start_codon:yes stop_codon:yes gene_type:complete